MLNLILNLVPLTILLISIVYFSKNKDVNKFLIFGKRCYSCGEDLDESLTKKDFGVPKKCKSCIRVDKLDLTLGNYRYLVNDIKFQLIKFSLGIGGIRKKFWIFYFCVFSISIVLMFFDIWLIYITNMIFPISFLIQIWIIKTCKSIERKISKPIEFY